MLGTADSCAFSKRKTREIFAIKNVIETCFFFSNDPVYLNLHSWLKGFGFSSYPPLKPAVFPETGRGLQASRTIQEGDVVVTIPVEALITRQDRYNFVIIKDKYL